MASPEAQQAAAKERIIKHMNADHQDSIQRYLQHSTRASPLSVRYARMTDITLTDMKFEYGGAKPTIHFDPPLASFREARERLVQMDQEALKALGLSDIRITNFIPPYADALSLVNFSVCILTWAAFGRPANFQPGSLLFDSLLFRFPAFASFCSTIQPFLFPIMALIHAYEVTLMMTKLERHSLLMDSWQWWAWVGSCFVEGWTSFKRLNGLISEKTREKESKKH